MKQSGSLILIVILMIVAAAVSRVIIYPVSFSPLIAMSLFGGAVIKDRKLAFILPLAAIFLSDFLFDAFNVAPGFYGMSQIVNYALLGLISIIGFNMKKISIGNVALFSVFSCVFFYLLSNTAYFFLSNPQYHTYPQNADGYMQTLVAGLPFLKANLISTACFAAVFFGIYVVTEKYLLQKQPA